MKLVSEGLRRIHQLKWSGLYIYKSIAAARHTQSQCRHILSRFIADFHCVEAFKSSFVRTRPSFFLFWPGHESIAGSPVGNKPLPGFSFWSPATVPLI